VRVIAPGFAARTYPVLSHEGVADDLAVEPGVRLPEAGARIDRGRRTAGWIVLGGGAASLAVGAVTGLGVIARGNDRRTLCPDATCPTQGALDDARSVDAQGKTLSLVSTTAFAVGGAAAAAGVFLLLTSRSKEEPTVGASASSIALAPAVGQRDATLSIAGSF